MLALHVGLLIEVPPSGGSLEIGNFLDRIPDGGVPLKVPPSGGSLEIGNHDR